MDFLKTIDRFIVLKLEAAMMYSPISPYAISRFLFTGAFLLAFLLTIIFSQFNDLSSILSEFCLSLALIWIYKKTYEGERQNSLNKINYFKVWYFWRLFEVFNCTVEIYNEKLNTNTINLIGSALDVFLVLGMYFMCLNWIKPNNFSFKFKKSGLAFSES